MARVKAHQNGTWHEIFAQIYVAEINWLHLEILQFNAGVTVLYSTDQV